MNRESDYCVSFRLLGLLNAELSAEGYWRGPSSQGEGEGGQTIPKTTLSPPDWFCIKMGSDVSHLSVSLIVRGKDHKTVSLNHNFWRERKSETESNQRPSAY